MTLLFKVIQDHLVDIPAAANLTPASIGQEPITRRNSDRFHQDQMPTNSVSSLEPSQFGIMKSLPTTVAEVTDLVSFKHGLFTLTFKARVGGSLQEGSDGY